MTLEEMIGQTLVFGIPGTRVRPEDIRLFRETHAGGLILYRINFESPAQIRRLIADLESALDRKLLVTVDHEGGRVIMFGDGVTVFPDNLAFGVAGRPAYARAQGEIEARELRRLGIDVNFSPVVDVLTDAFSPNIGIRSYGADPKRVGVMAVSRIRAMQANGVSACAKHFPGLGPATLDPHLDLPVIRTTWKELRRMHLPPFDAAIKAGVDLVMSSHPLYPRLEPAPKTPATFSRRLIEGLLRDELNFRGVISSDDLEMGALRDLCPPGRTAVLAAGAGHDLLLSCHDAYFQKQCHAALLDAYKSGELSVERLEKSVERIRLLKEKRRQRFAAGSLKPERAGAVLAQKVANEAVRISPPRSVPSRKGLWFLKAGSRKPSKRPLLSVTAAPVLIVYPRVREMAKRVMVEKALCEADTFLRRELGRFASKVSVSSLSLLPSPTDLERLSKAATGKTVIFFVLDAHLVPGTRRILSSLQKVSKDFTLVPLLDFYDAVFARSSARVVTAFGARVCQIKACLDFLFGTSRS